MINLIALILSTALAQNVCNTLTIENVNSCTLDEKFVHIMKIIRPNYSPINKEEYDRGCPPDAHECVDPKILAYTFEPYDTNNPKTKYERLVMENNKPRLSDLNAAFIAWKNEQENRIEFRNRVMAVENDNFKIAAHRCGYTQPNKEILRKNVIKNMDIDKIHCIETKVPDVVQEKEAENIKREAYNNAKASIKAMDCSKLSSQFEQKACILLQR